VPTVAVKEDGRLDLGRTTASQNHNAQKGVQSDTKSHNLVATFRSEEETVLERLSPLSGRALGPLSRGSRTKSPPEPTGRVGNPGEATNHVGVTSNGPDGQAMI